MSTPKSAIMSRMLSTLWQRECSLNVPTDSYCDTGRHGAQNVTSTLHCLAVGRQKAPAPTASSSPQEALMKVHQSRSWLSVQLDAGD